MTRPEPERVPWRGARLLAILGLSAGLVGFGIHRSGGLPDVSRFWRERAPETPPPDVPVLEGSRLGPPSAASWNGQETRTQQFASDLSPREIADLYARQFARSNLATSRAEDLPAGAAGADGLPELVSRYDTPYFSIVTTRSEEGRHVGVVVLPTPEGGSTYFLSETLTTDGPGLREKPSGKPRVEELPAPPFSTERFSIEGLGEPGSRLALYESRAGRERILSFYRDEMPARGWERLEEEGEIVNEALSRGYALLFRQPGQELMVVTMPRPNGVEAVTVILRNKK
ncbi:MAG: hypothetical protein HY720_18355 [Planctomycetes bacterium]|nr:hypothetical protein [Planctomycetota bacterium]